MPHQCVHCSKFYPDGDAVILKGCPCGGRLFFFIKPDKLKKIQDMPELNLSKEQRVQMEEDINDIIGTTTNEPVILDIEAVRVTSPGKYELDLVHLFKGGPIIFKVEEGKYIIDIPETFRRMTKKT